MSTHDVHARNKAALAPLRAAQYNYEAEAVRAALGADGPPIWAMIETCGAVLRLPEIVGAAAACAAGSVNPLATTRPAQATSERRKVRFM